MSKRLTLIAENAQFALDWITLTPHHAAYVHEAHDKRALVIVGDKSRLVILSDVLEVAHGAYQPSNYAETGRMFEPVLRLPAPSAASN